MEGYFPGLSIKREEKKLNFLGMEFDFFALRNVTIRTVPYLTNRIDERWRRKSRNWTKLGSTIYPHPAAKYTKPDGFKTNHGTKKSNMDRNYVAKRLSTLR